MLEPKVFFIDGQSTLKEQTGGSKVRGIANLTEIHSHIFETQGDVQVLGTKSLFTDGLSALVEQSNW